MTRKRLKLNKRKKHQQEVRESVRKIERSHERQDEAIEYASQSMWMFQELAQKLPQTKPDIGCRVDVDSDGQLTIDVGDVKYKTQVDLKNPVQQDVVDDIMASAYKSYLKNLRSHLEAEDIAIRLVPNIRKILKNVYVVGDAPYIRVVGLPNGLGIQCGPRNWLIGRDHPDMLSRKVLTVVRQIARLYDGLTVTFETGLFDDHEYDQPVYRLCG